MSIAGDEAVARRRVTSAISGAPAQVRLEVVEEVRRAAERGDHAVEALGGGAGGEGVADPRRAGRGVGGEAGGGEELAAERHGDVAEPAVDRVAAQEARGVRHLERVAGGGGQRLVHVGDQRPGRAAGAVRDLDQRLGPARGRRRSVAMKAPVPVLTSRTSASSPAASFFDRIEAVMRSIELDRAGDVADGVEAPVGRGDVGGLADDGAADLAHHAAEGLGVGLGGVAGDRVELVERAAGVAEAAAGDHRHEGAAGGERRARASG